MRVVTAPVGPEGTGLDGAGPNLGELVADALPAFLSDSLERRHITPPSRSWGGLIGMAGRAFIAVDALVKHVPVSFDKIRQRNTATPSVTFRSKLLLHFKPLTIPAPLLHAGLRGLYVD